MKKQNIFDGVVVVLLIVFVWWIATQPRPESTNSARWDAGTLTAPTLTETEETGQGPGATTATAVPTSVTSALTYEEAIQRYDGLRFQFVSCHGTPGSLTLKKGSTYMLDNRDDKTHAIKVGSKSYSFGAYVFKIVTASELGTLNITCDGGGAATLIVQP